jgi:tetratricopeptide (TPR) repeat protein
VYVDGPSDEQVIYGDNPPAQAPQEQQGDAGLSGTVIQNGSDGKAKDTRLPEEELQRLMVEGINAFSEGKYEKAAIRFLTVAMEDRENPDAMLAFAVARFATEDYRISALAIRRGISQFPELVDSAFNIVDRYGDKDDFKDHLEELEEYVEDHPENADGWLVMGFVQHFMHARERAAKTFEALKHRSPKDAELADVFLKAKPLAEVLQELEKQMAEELEQELTDSQPVEK